MKLFHLADLHIGKKVNGFNLIEDQAYILNQILDYTKTEKPEAILISGDVYDKDIPTIEAVNLFNNFLDSLNGYGIAVYIISGNHDSAERLAFGANLLKNSNIYISTVFKGTIEKYSFNDNIDIYMLPFIKPSNVRMYVQDDIKDSISSYNDAIKYVIDNTDIDTKKCNILLSHQFITGASTCDSEEIYVGGVENVNYEVYDKFDYVALGHLHGSQHIVKENIRYAGSPLKYSFSEVNQKKSITVIDIDNKNIEISHIYLKPLKDMLEYKDSYIEIINNDTKYPPNNNYIKVCLTDNDEIMYAMDMLRKKFPNIMRLEYGINQSNILQIENSKIAENKFPFQWFDEFYKLYYEKDMELEEKEYILKIIDKVWGE